MSKNTGFCNTCAESLMYCACEGNPLNENNDRVEIMRLRKIIKSAEISSDQQEERNVNQSVTIQILTTRNKELETELEATTTSLDQFKSELKIDELQTRLKKYEEALNKYADKNNWGMLEAFSHYWNTWTPDDENGYEIAQQALTNEGDEK